MTDRPNPYKAKPVEIPNIQIVRSQYMGPGIYHGKWRVFDAWSHVNSESNADRIAHVANALGSSWKNTEIITLKGGVTK